MRREQPLLRFAGPAQQLVGSGTELVARLVDGRQRWIRHRSELDVVVADHRNVVRYAHPSPAEPVDDADRQEVVGAEDRGRGRGGEELFGGSQARRGVHRLDLEFDQIALRLESRVGQRRHEADAPVLALRDGQRPVHECDPPVAQLEEMLTGQPAAEHVVDDDGRDVTGRAAMVEEHERDTAVGQPFEIALVLARGIDDDPADALARQRVERAPLVGQQPVGVADHDRLAVRRGQVLGPAGDLGEERVPDVRHDQADERRLPGP